jgi:hypothetical protein
MYQVRTQGTTRTVAASDEPVASPPRPCIKLYGQVPRWSVVPSCQKAPCCKVWACLGAFGSLSIPRLPGHCTSLINYIHSLTVSQRVGACRGAFICIAPGDRPTKQCVSGFTAVASIPPAAPSPPRPLLLPSGSPRCTTPPLPTPRPCANFDDRMAPWILHVQVSIPQFDPGRR